jgi:hypothetical protein
MTDEEFAHALKTLRVGPHTAHHGFICAAVAIGWGDLLIARTAEAVADLLDQFDPETLSFIKRTADRLDEGDIWLRGARPLQ